MSMATPKEAFDQLSERKEQLRKVFTEFESKKFSLGRIGATWKDIEEHFREIETCLEKTHEAYKAKEKAFETRVKSVQAELDKLDAEVCAEEQASVRRVQSQKDAAVAAIMEEKRKFVDKKRKWDAEKQRAETGARDIRSLEKDTESKKNTSTSNKGMHPTKIGGGKKPDDVSIKKASTQEQKALVSSKAHREPRPKLKSICQNLDPDGFVKIIIESQKELETLQEEVPSALKLCSDPAQLVLKTLERYLDMDKIVKQEFRRVECFVCTMLFKCLSEVLGDNTVVSAKVKKSAKGFADKWKAVLNVENQIGYSQQLVGHSFLQFVATFGLSNEYSQEELCEIVAKVARQKQTVNVFRLLGLSNKAPEMIERLIKESKFIEAVLFASELDLLERFPPAPLLNSHIKEAKKAAKTLMNNGRMILAAQNEAFQKELAALKAVANVVKECKLEGYFSLDDMDKQIATLEETRAERKRVYLSAKTPQPSKKPRTEDGSPIRGQSGSPSPGRRALQGLHDRNLYDGARISPLHGFGSMPDLKPRLLDRRSFEEFDRRLLEEYEWRHTQDTGQRPLGLYNAAYGTASQAPVNYGHPFLSLTSLAYRSSIPNALPAYGNSAFPTGSFKPFL